MVTNPREQGLQDRRRMMRFATALSVLVLLLLAACANTGSQTRAAGSSDSDVKQALTTRLTSDPQLQAANTNIAVSVDNKKVTLSGTVASEALRKKAVQLAKSTNPDLVLRDNIEVKPAEVSRSQYTRDMADETRTKAKQVGDKLGKSLDDAWLYTKIEAKLATGTGTQALKIHVDVSNKVVVLRGQVESAATKKEADGVARRTQGVRRVIDRLTVQKAG
jgi:osmotically-inducible protein OsmY